MPNGNANNGNSYWAQVAANGTPAPQGTCPAPMPIVLPTGNSCQKPPLLLPTDPTVIIDPNKVGFDQCGVAVFTIDNTRSGAVITEIDFVGGSGCARHFVQCPDEDIEDMYDSDIVITAPHWSGETTDGGALACWNELVEQGVFVKYLDLKFTTQAGADGFNGTSITGFTYDPTSSGASCTRDFEYNDCSTCYTSTSGIETIRFEIGMFISRTSGFFFNFPVNAKAKVTLCIGGFIRSGNFTPCGDIQPTCAY